MLLSRNPKTMIVRYLVYAALLGTLSWLTYWAFNELAYWLAQHVPASCQAVLYIQPPQPCQPNFFQTLMSVLVYKVSELAHAIAWLPAFASGSVCLLLIKLVHCEWRTQQGSRPDAQARTQT